MPSINDLNRNTEFNLPDGYFEKLQDDILTRVHRYEKGLKQRKITYFISSIAASFLIIFSLTYFFSSENPENLVSLIPDNKEVQLMYDTLTNQHVTEVKTEEKENVPQKSKTPVKQMIAKTTPDNLNYDIIEYYQDAMYDVAMLDLYD